jgi:hypothetical protein
MEFENDFFKYKIFGLHLKGNLSEDAKIFDLFSKNSKKHVFKKGEVQKNIKFIYQKYGENFSIKYKDHILPVNLTIKCLPNGREYFSLKYDFPNRTLELLPFRIDFIDNISMELNNITYIGNIHRTTKISGNEMVQICLRINKLLGATKTRLIDAAGIYHNDKKLDLSYLKLLERGQTFYMNLGFDFELTNTQFMYFKFDNKKQLKIYINDLIDRLKSIKIQDIIDEYNNILDLLNLAVKENNKNSFQIILTDEYDFVEQNFSRYKDKPFEIIPELFQECYYVLSILNNSSHIYLYELLVELFKNSDKLNLYSKLIQYLTESYRHKIIYGDSEVTRTYNMDFMLLKKIRQDYFYSYTF